LGRVVRRGCRGVRVGLFAWLVTFSWVLLKVRVAFGAGLAIGFKRVCMS